MSSPAADVARRLGENAEAVCRRYLSNGRREGHYWLVGDVHNAPGRSLYVRLSDHSDGRGAAGKWTDAASGDHGDLLDVIAFVCTQRQLDVGGVARAVNGEAGAVRSAIGHDAEHLRQHRAELRLERPGLQEKPHNPAHSRRSPARRRMARP